MTIPNTPSAAERPSDAAILQWLLDHSYLNNGLIDYGAGFTQQRPGIIKGALIDTMNGWHGECQFCRGGQELYADGNPSGEACSHCKGKGNVNELRADDIFYYYEAIAELDSRHPAESGSAEPVASDEDRGLYGKFYVERNDGSSKPGGKHEGCDYFVLDLTHDPFAMPALRAYAANCAKKYPQLAADLREKLPDVDAGWWGSYECFGCSLVFDVQTTYDPDDVVNCPKCKGTCDLRGRWLADVGSFGGRSEFIVLPQPSTPGAVSDEDLRQWRFALERAIESQRLLAEGIDKDNPDDPWASLMVWEDVTQLGNLATALESFAKRGAAATEDGDVARITEDALIGMTMLRAGTPTMFVVSMAQLAAREYAKRSAAPPAQAVSAQRRREAAMAELSRDDVLPCDVLVAPGTIIRAGCNVSTLLLCLGNRVGREIAKLGPRGEVRAPQAVSVPEEG